MLHIAQFCESAPSLYTFDLSSKASKVQKYDGTSLTVCTTDSADEKVRNISGNDHTYLF